VTLLIIAAFGVGLFAIVYLWARSEEKRLRLQVERRANPFQPALFGDRTEDQHPVAAGARR
jgi:hypothetical protein